MTTIREEMTPAAFAELDARIARKLAHVAFGSNSRADRHVAEFRFLLENGRTPSWRARCRAYQACYLFRDQLADTPFVARVLIAKAEADSYAEEERRSESRGVVRAWSAETQAAV
jgi:hypothetical protein